MVLIQTPLVSGFSQDITNLKRQINTVVRQIGNDLATGAGRHLYTDIANIGTVSKNDFENTQLRFYKDTSDSDKKWMVTMLGDVLFKSEFIAL